MTVVIMLGSKSLILSDELLTLAKIEKFLILQIEVVHITMGSMMVDVQRRIEANELHQGVLHRQYATADTSAASIDIGMSLKDFRETLKHATCYILLLLGTQLSKVTPMVFGIATDDV